MRAPWFPERFDQALHQAGTGMHLDAVLTILGSRQHATASSAQVLELGYGRRPLERRLASGHLVIAAIGVYVMGSDTPTAAGWRMAAIHAGGAASVLGDLSAAAHLGAPVIDPYRVQIIVPPGQRVRRPRVDARDAIVHPHERQVVDDIPCLTWPRLLLDIAAHRPAKVLANVWHDTVYRRLLEPEDMERVLADHRGEPGIILLRDLWERRLSAIGESQNRLEADLRDIVVAAGMPEPRRNQTLVVDGVRLRPDLLIPERALALETDGKDAHADPEQQRADAAKDALYRRLGLTPVRYAWWPVNYQRQGVEADFARYEAWWQRTRGIATPRDLPPAFRLARRPTAGAVAWAA